MQHIDLIDFNDVRKIFGKSIQQMRTYKKIGLIKHCKRSRGKDFFNKYDIMRRKKYIDDQIDQGKTLDEIAVTINDQIDQGKALNGIADSIHAFEKSLPSYLDFKEGQKKILIVDDYEPLCDVYSQMIFRKFSEDEIAVLSVHDAEKALELAQKAVPDLIILDIALKKGGMTGIELYEKLKENPLIQNAKFLFISSVIEYHQVDTEFLPKPINHDKLLEIVRNLFQNPPQCSKTSLLP